MMPDAFLEPLYRWLRSVAEWLLASSTMESWFGVVGGVRMVEGVVVAALLLVAWGSGRSSPARATRPSSGVRRAFSRAASA